MMKYVIIVQSSKFIWSGWGDCCTTYTSATCHMHACGSLEDLILHVACSFSYLYTCSYPTQVAKQPWWNDCRATWSS